MNMKKIILSGLIVTFLASCGGSGNGELIGVQKRKTWNPTDPYGMVFIPQGTFTMGPSDQDVPFANVSESKSVSVGAFYMDETEITNNEYRQFTRWVRDSILRTEQYNKFKADLKEKGQNLSSEDKLQPTLKWTVDDAPLALGVTTEEIEEEEEDFNPTPVWRQALDWDEKLDMEIVMKQSKYYFVDYETGRKKFDTRELVYRYKTLDLKNLARKSSDQNDNVTRDIDPKTAADVIYEKDKKTGEFKRDDAGNLIVKQQYEGYNYPAFENSYVKEHAIHIYPDTLSWVHDYAYSFNDPYTKHYFSHPAFDDYPVVGVNWHQAVAFTNWRTMMMNNMLRDAKQPVLPDFRLPTEAEWEYAARGGLDNSPYPWGGPYTRNIKGCFLANFKPLRGNYTADGGIKTIKTAEYNPNGYGLYDMSGNVAEWTSNTYDESALSYAHDMNTDMGYEVQEGDAPVMKRKVIRGGSWKDVAYFIQTSTRTFEYQDTAKCYIGFRCAVDFLGRDKKDFE